MSKEILDQIRTSLEGQVKQVMGNEEMSQLYVHEVTQSYLLLQILDRLDAKQVQDKIFTITIDAKGLSFNCVNCGCETWIARIYSTEQGYVCLCGKEYCIKSKGTTENERALAQKILTISQTDSHETSEAALEAIDKVCEELLKKG